jgi:hypothetical protein
MRQETMYWRRWRCGCPLTWGLRDWAWCSERFKRNSETNFMFSQELEMRKEAALNSVWWLKKVIKE